MLMDNYEYALATHCRQHWVARTRKTKSWASAEPDTKQVDLAWTHWFLRRCNGSISMQTSKHSSRCHRGRGRPKNCTWKREREIRKRRCGQQDNASRGLEEDGGGSTELSWRWGDEWRLLAYGPPAKTRLKVKSLAYFRYLRILRHFFL